MLPGARTFLERLQGAGIPAALACSSSPSSLLLDTEAEALGIRHLFDVILGGDDAQRGRPDPELYLYAAQRLQRPPQRSVVIGSGNAAVEAAREGGMRVVAVSGPGSAAYELSAADCVVRQLDALTVSDLKQLFAFESVAEEYEAQTELEEDEEEEDDDAWEGRGGSRGDDRDRMAAFYGSSLY